MESLIQKFSIRNEVIGIGFGGSSAAKASDILSDIDIYIFVKKQIPLEYRYEIIKEISSKYEIGGEYFGPGDEFYYDKIKKQIDLMYFDINWFHSIVNNVWIKHIPSNGYTTCFLYTLKNLEIKYDKTGYLKELQNLISSSYPKELKDNIIKRNLMLLCDKPFASYYGQIESAVKRKDFISINHRISAFLASYFDIIFALNELLHPGEKRLIQFAKNNCKILPDDFEKNINELLEKPNKNTLANLDRLIFNLRKIL